MPWAVTMVLLIAGVLLGWWLCSAATAPALSAAFLLPQKSTGESGNHHHHQGAENGQHQALGRDRRANGTRSRSTLAKLPQHPQPPEATTEQGKPQGRPSTGLRSQRCWRRSEVAGTDPPRLPVKHDGGGGCVPTGHPQYSHRPRIICSLPSATKEYRGVRKPPPPPRKETKCSTQATSGSTIGSISGKPTPCNLMQCSTQAIIPKHTAAYLPPNCGLSVKSMGPHWPKYTENRSVVSLT